MPIAPKGSYASQLRVFEGVPAELLDDVLRDCPIRDFACDRILLEAGQVNRDIYFVLSGRLRVHLGALDASPYIAVPAGECSGEFSIIDGGPTSAFVVAEAGTRVLVVPEERFWRDLLTVPGVARNFLRLLTRRTREVITIVQETTRRQLAYDRLEHELRFAREMQASMVPAGRPLFEERAEVDGFALMEPARAVGGDFLDAFPLGGDRLFLTIGDVAGKGVPGALLMARTMALLRMEAARDGPLPKLLSRVNQLLCEGNTSSMFVTVFCGVLDLASGGLEYVSGGHVAPLVCGPDGRASFLATPQGTIVGALEHRTYETALARLLRGDLLLLYTDGVTEAVNARGDMFTSKRLRDTVSQASQAPDWDPRTLVERLRHAVVTFAAGEPQSDDIALLAIQYHA